MQRWLRSSALTPVDIAYLHDTMEDTATTFDMLLERFGSVVARCVALVSDPAGANRRERKAKLYVQLEFVKVDILPALKGEDFFYKKAMSGLGHVPLRICSHSRAIRLMKPWNFSSLPQQRASQPSTKSAEHSPGSRHETLALFAAAII